MADETLAQFAQADEEHLANTGRTGSRRAAVPSAELYEDLGYILDEEDEEKVAKHIQKLREDQEPAMSRRRAVGKRNRWWREGRRFVRLEKFENESRWEAKLPLGALATPPLPNRTDRLCRRAGNTILTDGPIAECEPGNDANDARDAAEFATRYLKILGQPALLNFKRILRRAFQKACTFMSAYAWVTIDPKANGKRPRKMLAHPLAQTYEDALIDPNTGLQAAQKDLVDRYIRSDRTLTDNPDEADIQWLPGPKVRILTFHNVTLLPETCSGIEDCDGVIIADTTTLGELRTMFPDKFEGMNEQDMEKLAKWKPTNHKDLLPVHAKEPEDQKDDDGKYRDEHVVYTLTCYYRTCDAYPCGAYAIVSGDFLLHRQKWSAKMPPKRDVQGKELPSEEESLMIPVAQERCMDDDVNDDYVGIALADKLGPADEISASSLGYSMEYMFRFGNRNVFLPHGSIVQPKQLLLRDGNPIYVNPQGKPFYEDVPPLPDTIPALRQEMREEQDDDVGLRETAQGVEVSSVKSGVHAQAIIGEAQKAMTEMKDNLGDFFVRMCEIILEQSRAFIEVPQLLRYQGEDGDYKELEFTRLDFAATRAVTIARGSFTMQTNFAKMQMATEARGLNVIDDEELRETWLTGMSPVIGTQDNPHLLRVRRQIDHWSKGPPEDFDKQLAAYQAQVQQYQVAQEAAAARAQMAAHLGVAPTGPALPPEPVIPGPFTNLPIDHEPGPAKIRHRQLARLMATPKYSRQSENWRWVFDQAYNVAKNDAGVITVPEMQRMQAEGKMPRGEQGAEKPAREGAGVERANRERKRSRGNGRVIREGPVHVHVGGEQRPKGKRIEIDRGDGQRITARVRED